MEKTPEHQALIDRVRHAELYLHEVRIELERRKQALREYRRANMRKLRPKKPTLEQLVLGALRADTRRRPTQIAAEVGYTRQAVRRELIRLVKEKRVTRLGRPGQHTFYSAVPQKEAAE